MQPYYQFVFQNLNSIYEIIGLLFYVACFLVKNETIMPLCILVVILHINFMVRHIVF